MKLPYVKAKKRKTGATYYVQIKRTGPTVRLKHKPDDPQFMADYLDAVARLKAGVEDIDRRKKPGSHTVGQLVDKYRKSQAMAHLRPATRRGYGYDLSRIQKRFGKRLFRSLSRRDIVLAMDEMAPTMANSFLQMFTALNKWADERQLTDTFPAAGIRRNPGSKIGYPAWPDDQVDKYRSYWPVGTMERLAMDLFTFTGMRVGDVVELGPQHIRDGILSRRLRKTGQQVTLPVPPDLAASIAATETGSTTFLRLKRFDRPFADSQYFGTFFRRACAQAGISGDAMLRALSGHGLRKTVLLTALKNGATTIDAMALQGWSTTRMVDHYARQVDRAEIGRKKGHFLFRDAV